MAIRPGFERKHHRARATGGTAGRMKVATAALFALPFAGGGLFIMVQGMLAFEQRRSDAIAMVIFGLAFVGIGAGVVVMARKSRQTLESVGEQIERNADRPWLVNDDWKSGVIQGSSRMVMWVSWGFALVWCAFSIPLTLALPAEVAKGNELALIGLAFPISGLGMLAWAAVSTARYRRFGRTELHMQTLPGVLGGELRVRLTCQKPLPADAALRVTLRNLRRTVSGSGNNRSVNERALWEDYRDVPTSHMTLRPDGYGLEIRMPVPHDTQASDPLLTNDCVLWRLLLHAELPGADFSTQFDIPIFETPESDPSLTSGGLSRKRSKGTVRRDPSESPVSGVDMRRTGSGLELHFPPARNKSAATGVTVATAVFGSATCFMAGHVPLLFPIAFGFASTLLLVGTVNLWLSSLNVGVEAQGVTLTRRMLGIPRRRFIPRSEIDSVHIEAGMRAGNTTYWDVRLALSSGGFLPGPRIGPSICDRHSAEELQHCVEDVLRLS